MNLLAVDTSGPVAGVAVLKDGEVAYEGAAVNRLTHSVNLMPMIEEALGRAGLDVSEIGLYAAVTGPGSFTGVRIGVSAVKGMAHGAGKPCVGVDALEALAAGACLTDALICPIQDARAGQVYGAAFLAGMPPVRMLPNMAEALPVYLDRALAVAGERRLCFLGDGVNTYRDAIVERLGERAVIAPAHMRYLRPASVGELAWLNRERSVDYLALMPVYLRAPQRSANAPAGWEAGHERRLPPHDAGRRASGARHRGEDLRHPMVLSELRGRDDHQQVRPLSRGRGGRARDRLRWRVADF